MCYNVIRKLKKRQKTKELIKMILFNNRVYDLESSVDRYWLHTELEEVYDKEFYIPDFEDEDLQALDEELAAAHDLISAKDEKGLEDHTIGFNYELSFSIVESNELLIDALKETGYEFEKSAASLSVYITNRDGEEVRIADHKRPSYEVGGVFYDHEYEHEIIVKENTVYKKQLENAGVFLPKEKYYLG